jgi:Tfp pilus assembly protein PilV
MKNILNKYYLAFMAVILFGSVYSQTQISGSVMDSDSMEAIPGVNVIIDGLNIGTVTDFDGNFVINTSQDAPLTLIISYMGYSAERVEVTSASQDINVSMITCVWARSDAKMIRALARIARRLSCLELQSYKHCCAAGPPINSRWPIEACVRVYSMRK